MTDSPLRELPNAILTPHCVGHSREGAEAVPRTAIANIERIIAGEPPVYVVNPRCCRSGRRSGGSNTRHCEER